ncbi:MAG: hypothetical protein ACYTGO_14930 [Planctomycetota bacterium]
MGHASVVVPWLSFVVVVLVAGAAPCQQDEQARKLGRRDIDRIRELHHLTDVLGEQLWPGFDTREIPIAVNNNDREEMLIGHPAPPAAFRAFEGHEIDGKPAMIRDGVTRFGPRGGGWAVSLGGRQTAYVGVLQRGLSTERYLSLLLHECFHVYQKDYRARGRGKTAALPTDDADYAAMIGLESHVLHAALQRMDLSGVQDEGKELRALCKMFVAVRQARRASLSAAVVRNEGEHEYSEGTATYVQARLFQLLMRKGGIEPVAKIRDPHYHGFAGDTTGYRRYKAGVLPSRRRPISFFHSQYQHGMAQCLLLDRVRPEWKTEMRERGQTQFDLLQKEFPITDTERAALVESAKQRFGYGSLLATQRRLVGDRLARIKAYLHAKGRRYRVYHSAIPARFRWKPSGPVYTVPASLLGAEAERIVIERGGGTAAIRNPRVSIWAGGIQRFEKSGLLFESKAVPIIFRPDYMEWIDPDPDSDGDDFKIESKREVDGVRHDVKITTDGFTLRADRVRIETSDDGDIVTIRPVRG